MENNRYSVALGWEGGRMDCGVFGEHVGWRGRALLPVVHACRSAPSELRDRSGQSSGGCRSRFPPCCITGSRQTGKTSATALAELLPSLSQFCGRVATFSRIRYVTCYGLGQSESPWPDAPSAVYKRHNQPRHCGEKGRSPPAEPKPGVGEMDASPSWAPDLPLPLS